jgi:hypothetical protein
METRNNKEFFGMILKRKYKKISVNLDSLTLGKIDKLAGILKINRTVIIEGILLGGIDEHIKFSYNTLVKNKNSKELSKEDKIELEKMLNLLESFIREIN